MLSDDELNEYVTSLLKSQAKKQSAAYSALGFRAFLKNSEKDGPVGKPNTRFLKNIVRDVDGYNAALARKEERESRERLRDLRKREEKEGEERGNREEGRRGRGGNRDRRERGRSRSRSRRVEVVVVAQEGIMIARIKGGGNDGDRMVRGESLVIEGLAIDGNHDMKIQKTRNTNLEDGGMKALEGSQIMKVMMTEGRLVIGSSVIDGSHGMMILKRNTDLEDRKKTDLEGIQMMRVVFTEVTDIGTILEKEIKDTPIDERRIPIIVVLAMRKMRDAIVGDRLEKDVIRRHHILPLVKNLQIVAPKSHSNNSHPPTPSTSPPNLPDPPLSVLQSRPKVQNFFIPKVAVE